MPIVPIVPLSHFTPISQNKPIDIMSQFKCSSGPVDIMPAKFIYSVLDAIVPWLFTLINLSLSSGCFPDYLKTDSDSTTHGGSER